MRLVCKSKNLLVAVCLTSLLGGCANTSSYSKFATAGTLYTAAADQLLVKTRNIGIEATSEQILKEDVTLQKQVKLGVISAEDAEKNLNEIYTDNNDSDKQLIAIVSKLRSHVALLASYFNHLTKLSAGSQSQDISNSINALTTNLNSIGDELRDSGIVSNPTVIDSLTSLVVSAKIRGALRTEFIARQNTIRGELLTQELVLDRLSSMLSKDLEDSTERQHERIVKRPLLADGVISSNNVQNWKETRKFVLTASSTVEELQTAKLKIGKLREVYEQLILEGESANLDAVITDLHAFLNLVETLNT